MQASYASCAPWALLLLLLLLSACPDESGALCRPRGKGINDKREGVGTYTYACGDVYTGEWKNGMYEGNGVCAHPAATRRSKRLLAYTPIHVSLPPAYRLLVAVTAQTQARRATHMLESGRRTRCMARDATRTL